MSQSIKRDGWYFRSFGYIKRKLSVLTRYYLPSYRTFGPGNREAGECAPVPGTCSRYVRLCAADPGWPSPWHTTTATLFIWLWSETRIVTLRRSGGWVEEKQGQQKRSIWGSSSKIPIKHPPTTNLVYLGWKRRWGCRAWIFEKAPQEILIKELPLTALFPTPTLIEKPNPIS